MGLPCLVNPQLQARLHLFILEQAEDLGMQAILKVANMTTASQSYTALKQGAAEPYLHLIDQLQDALEKHIVNKEAKEQIILQLARHNANEE